LDDEDFPGREGKEGNLDRMLRGEDKADKSPGLEPPELARAKAGISELAAPIDPRPPEIPPDNNPGGGGESKDPIPNDSPISWSAILSNLEGGIEERAANNSGADILLGSNSGVGVLGLPKILEEVFLRRSLTGEDALLWVSNWEGVSTGIEDEVKNEGGNMDGGYG